MWLTNEQAKQNYPNSYFYGEKFYIREGADIGEGAVIREGADIRERAVIREGADIGEGAVIREGADIGEGAVIREGADIGEGAVIREGAYIGEGADIGEGAVIREGADIRERAVIREGADIGEGALVITICAKYNCNIVPLKDHVEIRIGCETHTIDEWEKQQFEIAQNHCEETWWKESGQRIYEFLKTEAASYEKKYLKAGK